MQMLLQRRNQPPLDVPFQLNRYSSQARGLVGWWSLLDGLTDRHISRLGITLGNRAAWGRMQGERGIGLDITGDGGTTATIADGAVTDRSGSMSVSCWFVADSLAADAWLYLKGRNDGADYNYGVIYNASMSRLRFLTNNSSGFVIADSNAALSTGTLYHVVCVQDYDAGKMLLYLNGVLQTSQPALTGTAVLNARPLTLGGDEAAFSTSENWDGGIWDFRLYNRALSANEVGQLYDPATRWELYEPVMPMWVVGFVAAGGDLEGEAAITLGAVTLSSTGVNSIEGVASVTLDAATLSAAGTLAIDGALAATLGAVTLAAEGTAAIEGVAAITLGAVTLSAAGDTLIEGEADITLGEATLASTGIYGSAVDGEASITLGAMTLEATGELPIEAAAGVTLGAVTLNSAGELSIQALAAITLSPVTLASVSTLTILAAATITLGAVTLVATEEEPDIPTIAATIYGPRASGTITGAKASVTIGG